MEENKSISARLRVKAYIRYLSWLVPAIIAGNKFILRPWVRDHFDQSFLLILVHSLPNFVEAVIGTVALAGIGLILRARCLAEMAKVEDRIIYAFSTLLASMYVITQELNLHSLGGDNVYDPYDIGASVIGLLFINIVLNTYGLFIKPSP